MDPGFDRPAFEGDYTSTPPTGWGFIAPGDVGGVVRDGVTGNQAGFVVSGGMAIEGAVGQGDLISVDMVFVQIAEYGMSTARVSIRDATDGSTLTSRIVAEAGAVALSTRAPHTGTYVLAVEVDGGEAPEGSLVAFDDVQLCTENEVCGFIDGSGGQEEVVCDDADVLLLLDVSGSAIRDRAEVTSFAVGILEVLGSRLLGPELAQAEHWLPSPS